MGIRDTGSCTLTVTQQSGNGNTTLADAAFIAVGPPAKVNLNAAGQMRYFKFTPAATGNYYIWSADNVSADPYGYLYKSHASGGTQITYNNDMGVDRNFRMYYFLMAGTETVYTYDKNDRLLTEQAGDQAQIDYDYDKNGNMTSKSNGIGHTFDALNRMTHYQNGNTYGWYTLLTPTTCAKAAQAKQGPTAAKRMYGWVTRSLLT